MTEHAVKSVPFDGIDDDAPPPGTAIVRPLRHVRAVRQRHAQQLAERSLGSESRSARAWSWALGETDVAPVTDRATVVPPGRSDIEAEIAVADERRLRGGRENRADGAATVLRWLIGEDDHVPVRGQNCGELVGGFGNVVRSLGQIREMLVTLEARQGPASARGIGSGFGSAGAKEVLGRVQRVVGPAIDAAKVVLDRSKAVQPDRVELKFGVMVSGDANWLVAKAASEGNFEITLTWERLAAPHPDDVLIDAADKGRREAILAGGQPLAVIGGEDDPA